MSGLAHHIEAAGIATTLIALVREHVERMCPPRSLWVPFMLGRPLGVPDDAAFQARVLRAALGLLTRRDTPIIEDFPEDAPADPRPQLADGLACPVSFPQPEPDPHDIGAALRREVASLSPWYEVSVRSRGRTAVGTGDLSPEQAASTLAALLGDDVDEAAADPRQIKCAIEDLKAYYLESAMVRPDRDALGDLNEWLWRTTTLAEAMRALAARYRNSQRRSLRFIAEKATVPRIHAV